MLFLWHDFKKDNQEMQAVQTSSRILRLFPKQFVLNVLKFNHKKLTIKYLNQNCKSITQQQNQKCLNAFTTLHNIFFNLYILRINIFFIHIKLIQSHMGSSPSFTHVSIIDKYPREGQYQVIKNQKRLKYNFYDDFDKFIQKQQMKKAANVIVRIKANPSDPIHQQKEIMFETLEKVLKQQSKIDKNQQQYKQMKQSEKNIRFQLEQILKRQEQIIQKTCNKNKEKLIGYVKKYSEERLNVYLFVNDVTSYRIPDYEIPYISMISDNLQMIRNHILTCSGDQQNKINIKLKRLVKDQYRKIMLKVINPQLPKEWEDSLKSSKITYQVFKKFSDFQSTFISTYVEFVLCLPQDLIQIIDFKKQNDFQYRIIVIGTNKQVQASKKIYVWTIDDKFQSILEKVKRSSNLPEKQKKMDSTNTIVYIGSKKFQKHFYKIEQRAKIILGDQFINKYGVQFTKRYPDLFKQCQKSPFSLVVSFQTAKINQILMTKINEMDFQNRLHVNSLKDFNRDNPLEEIDQKLEFFKKSIKMVLKTEYAPIQTITVFNCSNSTLKFFQHKAGLKVKHIPTILKQVHRFPTQTIDDTNKIIQYFLKTYEPPNFIKIIEGQHLVLSCSDYISYNWNKFFQDHKNTYLKAVKIIIIDEKSLIENLLRQKQMPQRVVIVHYKLSAIKNYLEYAQANKVSTPFFPKNSLSNFNSEAKKMSRINWGSFINIQCQLNSRSQLFQNMFQQEDMKGKKYSVIFQRFAANERNILKNIQTYEKGLIKSFAKLWTVGYDILQESNLKLLKEDIKKCFYRCRCYQLLKISDEQFEDFYLRKIDNCSNFLDLQLSCIYIYSLPHGLSSYISDLFKSSRKCCLAIKIFCHYVVVLLTAFCTFDNEAMNFNSLVLYMEDISIKKSIHTIKQGDIWINIGFMHCFRNEDPDENAKNNCLVFELQTIPFLSQTRVKRALEVQKFSFYKQSTQFLIAPFTKFQILQKTFRNGKYYIKIDIMEDNDKKGFIHDVFEANNILETNLAKAIKNSIKKNCLNQVQLSKQIKKQKSLYKKTEIINFYEQKKDLLRLINKGIFYNEFFQASQQNKLISANQALFYMGTIKMTDATSNQKKKGQDKNSKAILYQNYEQYQNIMLNIEKSLILYKASRFLDSVKRLKKVIDFLNTKKLNDLDNWRLERLNLIRSRIVQAHQKRILLLEKMKKKKLWTISANRGCIGKVEKWEVNYHLEKEVFSIKNKQRPNDLIFIAKPQREFGEPQFPFSSGNQYETEFINSNKIQDQNQQKQSQYKQYKQKPEPQPEDPYDIFENFGIFNEEELVNNSMQALSELISLPPGKEENEQSKAQSRIKKEIEQGLEMEIQSGYTQVVQWQVFVYDGKLRMVRKKKHFQVKRKMNHHNRAVMQNYFIKELKQLKVNPSKNSWISKQGVSYITNSRYT